MTRQFKRRPVRVNSPASSFSGYLESGLCSGSASIPVIYSSPTSGVRTPKGSRLGVSLSLRVYTGAKGTAFSMPQQPTIGNTLGAIVIGLAGASLIGGVSTLQTYLYYHRFPYDKTFTKISAGCLCILDIFQLILMLHGVYYYVVINFGNTVGLNNIVWSFKLLVPMNVIIGCTVQALYLYRVYILGSYHEKWAFRILAGCIFVFITTLIFAIILISKTFATKDYTSTGSFSWALTGSLGAATVSDIALAAAMCYYLRKSKSENAHLNSRLSAMVQYTVSSGLLTGACSLVALLTRVRESQTLVYAAITNALPKLYVTSYLAMINSRNPKRDALNCYRRTSSPVQPTRSTSKSPTAGAMSPVKFSLARKSSTC